MGKLERKEVAVRVKNLMTRRLVSIDAEDTVTEAARLMDMMRIHSILHWARKRVLKNVESKWLCEDCRGR